MRQLGAGARAAGVSLGWVDAWVATLLEDWGGGESRAISWFGQVAAGSLEASQVVSSGMLRCTPTVAVRLSLLSCVGPQSSSTSTSCAGGAGSQPCYASRRMQVWVANPHTLHSCGGSAAREVWHELQHQSNCVWVLKTVWCPCRTAMPDTH